MRKFILLGGTGFVGTEIAKQLTSLGIAVASISRSGTMPRFLKPHTWAKEIEWVRADNQLQISELNNEADVLICLVGSPPLPTVSTAAYIRQLHQNSHPNIQAIQQAMGTDIKQLVVLGAHLPKVIDGDRFAYAKGKRLCLEAAEAFAESRQTRGSVVLQPTAIFGTRHTANGMAINLGATMKPFSKLQGLLPTRIQKFLPEQFVSVEAVAKMTVRAALDETYAGKFSIISNQEIANTTVSRSD